MTALLNIVALVIFAAGFFARSIDPVIPQIADGLGVTTDRAALLSTAFALPFALIQPVLGVIADSLGKIRLMMICFFVLIVATLVGGFATNFYVLMAARVVAGAAAGGMFPVSLALVGDLVPLAERQVAIGRLLAAAMTANLLGASAAGVIGDTVGWRGVFFSVTGLGVVIFVIGLLGFRGRETAGNGRFDLGALVPNFRAIFRNPKAKFCFTAVFVEGICIFGLFPYVASLLLAAGETRLSIAGLVLGGFGIGGVLYTLAVRRLLSVGGETWLMAAGGALMAFSFLALALRPRWELEVALFLVLGFGFYTLHGCIQVFVTEIAPQARATAMSLHSCFFFLGQASGPVVYGYGLTHLGTAASLVLAAIAMAGVGAICALNLRHAPKPS